MSSLGSVKLMPGSDYGSNYLMIARRGEIALGVKFVGVVPDPVRTSTRSYVVFRIRSASVHNPDHTHHEAEASNVVSFADQNLTLKSAWPNIEFRKVNSFRCSTMAGVFVEGSLTHPVGLLESVLSRGTLATLTGFIYDKIDPEHLVLDKASVVEWAEGLLKERLEGIKGKQSLETKFDEKTKELIGIAGWEADQLSILYDALEAADSKAKVIKSSGPAVEEAVDDEGGEEDNEEDETEA